MLHRHAALLVALLASSGSLVAACAGDDTMSALPDGGAKATDASAPSDATAGGDASGDAGAADAAHGDSAPDAATDAGTVQVQILAFNDFHGNLRPPSPSNAVVIAKPDDPAVLTDAGSPTPTDAGVVDGGPLNTQIYAGGAVYFAAHVKRLRAQNPNTILVSADDLTGASPLVSSLYDDEPTINVMNTIGLDFNSVGNHEFDHGPSELLRLQYGGCNLGDRTDAGGSCFADPSFAGAGYEYLAANVDVSSSKTIFPPYSIKQIAGAKIAFIGMTLKGTPTIVSPQGTAGLTFLDEVATVNALVPKLKAQGVDSIVVLLHQGGFQAGTYDECAAISGGTVGQGQLTILQIVDGLV